MLGGFFLPAKNAIALIIIKKIAPNIIPSTPLGSDDARGDAKINGIDIRNRIERKRRNNTPRLLMPFRSS
jgi:hypothetical protein